MKRKIIQLAGRTYVVSLPAEWIRKYNVKKGDEVDLEESGNKVIVSTSSELVSDKVSVDLTNSLPMTKRILGALYKSGYDEIQATFGSEEEKRVIEEVVKDAFIGFEVSYLGKNNVIIKEISKVDYDKFDEMLKRVFLITKTMGADCLEALKSYDKKLMEDVIKKDWDINKLTDFCRRILNKKGYLLLKKSSPIYFIVEQIEKIADCYRDICKYGLSSGVKISKDLEKLFNEVNEFFNTFYMLFYKFDLKATIDFCNRKKEISENAKQLIERVVKSEIEVISQLKNILENTFDMNGALIAAKL